jgi:uncharacterized protein
MIPFGVFANGGAVAAGGLFGILMARYLPKSLLKALPPVLGLCALSIGLVNIIKLDNLVLVILSLILGAIAGELGRLEERAAKLVAKLGPLCKEENRSLFLSLVVLFCASGTGIFGSLQAGMTGDHSILYAKAILDFFTSFSFALTLGILISAIALPQMLFQALLFYIAGAFFSTLPVGMIANFQAVGGLITFAIGLRILQIKELSVLNFTPALLLVFPLTWIWELF